MIVCLLPARNAEAELAAWLKCAGSFADAVVALDDGSTDATAELLEASPLVEKLLVDPPRAGYAGWDDRVNRQRLLDAAAELEPDWIFFLDADERIDADDAAVLRDFLLGDAIRGCAYGMPLFRDWGVEGVEPSPTVVFRCFAWEPGLRLPDERLHFTPVPVSIPGAAWLETTLRLRHLHSPQRSRSRAARYGEADPGGEWDRGQPPSAAERVPWTGRPAELPALVPSGLPSEAFFDRQAERRRLACLLPVRNGERELPDYLDSVSHFADAVIALDDGSTDSTAQLLEQSPLVEAVLTNPPRESYEGWDDRSNRQRLVEEGRSRGFDWCLFLDADERIDPDDARALRALIDQGADPALAYGFRVFRMTGADTFDSADLWVYRLFSASLPGDLPEGRLHFVPVPDSADLETAPRTTIRIQHLAGIDAQRREQRAAKYREADPALEFQASYENLTEPVGPPRPWLQRPAGYPLLADTDPETGTTYDLATAAPPPPDVPLLSAIVIARNDEERIERALSAVVAQECSAPFEVIAAVSGSDGTADLIRRRFPGVTVVDVPEPGLPGTARNAGLAVARGRYISFPGSHVEVAPGTFEARIEAHELGWPMVTGVLVNGNTSRAGWASYFLEASGSLPGRPGGPLTSAPARCSYAREALDRFGGFPESLRAGEDTAVNEGLWEQGMGAYRSPWLSQTHYSPCSTVTKLLAHHFARGRARGQILRREARRDFEPRLAPFALHIPLERIRDVETRVRIWGGELIPEYEKARPLILAAALASGAGMLLEVLRPGRSRI